MIRFLVFLCNLSCMCLVLFCEDDLMKGSSWRDSRNGSSSREKRMVSLLSPPLCSVHLQYSQTSSRRERRLNLWNTHHHPIVCHWQWQCNTDVYGRHVLQTCRSSSRSVLPFSRPLISTRPSRRCAPTSAGWRVSCLSSSASASSSSTS